MKYYCADRDECAHYFWIEGHTVDPEDLICPDCFGLVLIYPDYIVPPWVQNQPIEVDWDDEDPQ